MEFTHPLPALVITLVAYLTAWAMARRGAEPVTGERFEAIDGLRGYLALFVWLHHACIWPYYLRTGTWGIVPSPLYMHLGQSSVLLFFMITSLLFYTKILRAGRESLDWSRLYLGRVLRLAPLYFCVVATVAGICLLLSGFTLRDSPASSLWQLAKWLCFSIPGMPNLNGLKDSFTVVAGAPWTLPYEWSFYLALPLLALLSGRRVSALWLVVAAASLAGLTRIWWRPDGLLVLAFAGGIAAALLVRQPRFRKFCRHPAASFLVLGGVTMVVLAFPDAQDWRVLACLTPPFALMAGGCSVFGLLVTPASRMLGEITYSLYLLHGLLLFLPLQVGLGPERAAGLSPIVYWSLILALTPLLVWVGKWSFETIESPAMRLTPIARARLSRWFGRVPPTGPDSPMETPLPTAADSPAFLPRIVRLRFLWPLPLQRLRIAAPDRGDRDRPMRGATCLDPAGPPGKARQAVQGLHGDAPAQVVALTLRPGECRRGSDCSSEQAARIGD
jgi:peptidoglycan/LPS O-acetylase OafA/YrhL